MAKKKQKTSDAKILSLKQKVQKIPLKCDIVEESNAKVKNFS